MEEEKYKGSIPEATVVKDGKNQKKISCFTRTVVHYPCVVMLISGVISIILVAIVGSGDSFQLGSSWMNFEDKITKQCFATFSKNVRCLENTTHVSIFYTCNSFFPN